MPQETTAGLFIAPAEQPMSALYPTHTVLLVENFRPVWHVYSLTEASPRPVCRVATLNAPLADGLLAWVAAAAPALIASDPALDAFVSRDNESLRSLPTTQDRGVDPQRVYRACAGEVTVLAAIWPSSLLCISELEEAAECGLDIRQTTANTPTWGTR